MTAINAALSGRTCVTGEIAQGLARLDSKRAPAAKAGSLTLRQREVLQPIAEGRSAREVAKVLHISARTAENHKARIMDLLNLSTTADLVQYAICPGVIWAEMDCAVPNPST